MQRGQFIQASALTAVSLLASKNLLAQLLAEDPYKMRDLRGGVGIFTEKGGTIAYLITKEGIAVVTYMQGTGLERSLGIVYDEIVAG